MATAIFWEKPGCQGNARQKEILLASGHELDVRDLLTEPWTESCLAGETGRYCAGNPRPMPACLRLSRQ